MVRPPHKTLLHTQGSEGLVCQADQMVGPPDKSFPILKFPELQFRYGHGKANSEENKYQITKIVGFGNITEFSNNTLFFKVIT